MGSPRQRAAAAGAGAGACTGGGGQACAKTRPRGAEQEERVGGSKESGPAASSSSWVGWLGAQEGHPKHVGWLHPVVTCSLVTASTMGIVVRLADALQLPTQAPHQEQVCAALGLAVYTAFLLGVRVVATGSYALYEFLWACNLAMLLAALGLATARPLLVAAGVVAVSIDQGLWYVDVLGFLLTLGRKFPVGVAKYLTWPQTSWARRVTSTHHLWFMPYCLVFGREPWPLLGFPLSIAFVAVLDMFCRWVTPFRLPSQLSSPSPTGAGSVAAPTTTGGRRRSRRLQQQQQTQQRQEEEGDGGARYLNVNLVYELWKDIDVAFLKVSHPHPVVHLTRLVVLWSLLNVPFALVLFPLSRHKGEA